MQITIGENVRANRSVCGRGGGGYEDGNVGKKIHSKETKKTIKKKHQRVVEIGK